MPLQKGMGSDEDNILMRKILKKIFVENIQKFSVD